MSDTETKRLITAMSCVFTGTDDVGWQVAESPSEIAALVRSTPDDALMELTLGNPDGWNGKPLYVKANTVTAISPPRNINV